MKKSSDPSAELLKVLQIANLVPGWVKVRSVRNVATEVLDVAAYVMGVPDTGTPSGAALERYGYLFAQEDMYPDSLMDSHSVVTEAKSRWRKELETYPDLFRHLSAGLSDFGLEESRKLFEDRFREFELIRDPVSQLAVRAEEFRESRGEPMDFELPFNVHLNGSDGTIRMYTKWYVEAFNGVDLSKLHLCKAMIKTTDTTGKVARAECHNVFWQKPKHKTACSKACSNILSGRKHREKPENIAKAKNSRDQYGWGNDKKGSKRNDL